MPAKISLEREMQATGASAAGVAAGAGEGLVCKMRGLVSGRVQVGLWRASLPVPEKKKPLTLRRTCISDKTPAAVAHNKRTAGPRAHVVRPVEAARRYRVCQGTGTVQHEKKEKKGPRHAGIANARPCVTHARVRRVLYVCHARTCAARLVRVSRTRVCGASCKCVTHARVRRVL